MEKGYIPEELHEALKEEAASQNLSLQDYIIQILLDRRKFKKFMYRRLR
jgi:predicted HicB family RNase H-like nuclease